MTINVRRLAVLRSVVRKSKLDAIVSFGDKTNVLLLLATRGLGIPIIVAEHTDPRKWSIGGTASFLRKLLYPRANSVVVLTPELVNWAREIVRKHAIKVIPNPVGVHCGCVRQIGTQRQQRFVLGMGRLVFEKGFDILLRAFAQCIKSYPDWTLRLVGQGPEQQTLRNLAVNLGIEHAVRFEPVTRHPEKLFMESDLFVLSSRLEGFPMALLEAMASALPVISFDCMSGPREMIRHDVDGLLVPPEDVDALAKTMARLMGDQQERDRLAEKAAEVNERFGLPRVMEMWSEVLARAIQVSRIEQVEPAFRIPTIH